MVVLNCQVACRDDCFEGIAAQEALSTRVNGERLSGATHPVEVFDGFTREDFLSLEAPQPPPSPACTADDPAALSPPHLGFGRFGRGYQPAEALLASNPWSP